MPSPASQHAGVISCATAHAQFGRVSVVLDLEFDSSCIGCDSRPVPPKSAARGQPGINHLRGKHNSSKFPLSPVFCSVGRLCHLFLPELLFCAR